VGEEASGWGRLGKVGRDGERGYENGEKGKKRRRGKKGRDSWRTKGRARGNRGGESEGGGEVIEGEGRGD